MERPTRRRQSTRSPTFGDMPNDLPMLTAVGHSYAMANAHPDVLRAAHHRALANDEDGVAQLLEQFVDTLVRRPDRLIPGSTVREFSRP
ncbi:HAD family hydrolase [Streptomyces sp. NPDC002680]|uniref:HAD family hydrolase n=1 Tax=Streptomyces sp. NPDC002680 TaxID=3364659 RepID=UPI00367BB5CC